MVNQKSAYLYALSAVLLWSTVASAFKLALRYLDNVELLVFSEAFSVLILAVILISSRGFGQVFRCTRKEYLRSFLLGILNPFLYYLILFRAYELLPAQEAQPLNYTWGITISLLSVPPRTEDRRCGFCGPASELLRRSYHFYPRRVAELSNSGACRGCPGSLQHFGLGALLDLQHQGRQVTCPVPLYELCFQPARDHPLLSVFPSGTHARVSWNPRRRLCRHIRNEHNLCHVAPGFKAPENTAKVAGLIFASPFISLLLIHFFVGEPIRGSTIAGLVFVVGGLLVQNYGSRLRF